MYKRVAVQALRGALIKDKNEGILISSHINQRYFSGLDYTDGYVLILAEKAYLLADFRYIEVARAVVDAEVFEVVMPEGRMLTELGVLCAAEGVTKLYVEEETVSLADNGRLADAIGGVEIVGGASAEIEKLRAIKSQAELDKIAAAQKITDAAFEHILGFITPERTEKEVALELEFFMRSHGADGIAFETIAVSGSASSMPHGVPRDVKLERGFLTMDFGAFLDGYCSDMTRTVVIGKADADVRRVYETVLAAQTAALEYIAEGRECASVDKVARDLIDRRALASLCDVLQRRGLCREHRFVDTANVSICLADNDRSRHIRAVSVKERAEIHRQKSALKLYVSRHTVRHRGRAARNRDGLKGYSVSSVRSHKEFKLKSDLLFGALGRDKSKYVLKCRVGDLLCRRDLVKLSLRLDSAQLFDLRRCAAHDLNAADRIGETSVVRKGYSLLLNVKLCNPLCRAENAKLGKHSALGHHHLEHLGVNNSSRDLDVSEIRQKICLLCEYQNVSVGVVKSRKISLIYV